MTDRTDQHPTDPRDPETRHAETREEREVRHLLEEAGRRPGVPAEDLDRIKAAFRTEWEDHVRTGGEGTSERRFGRTGLLALAAGVLVALGLGWWWLAGPAAAPEIVARIEAVEGSVALSETAGEPSPEPGAGTELADGTELRTGTVAGRARLRLANGARVRLDTASRLRLLSPAVVELRRGALYAEAAGEGQGDALEIHTPLGVVRDVGTRFEVRLLPGGGGAASGGGGLPTALRVRVRDGRVDLAWDATSAPAAAGEQLTLHDDGHLEREPAEAYGPGWDWVLAVAPSFEVEGKTLAELLAWVGRETGWEIRYQDPALARAAEDIVLHGAFGEVRPDEAPGLVLPGAGLGHRLVDGTLVVER